MKQGHPVRILGIDPGFKNLGYAILDWFPSDDMTELLEVGTFHTEKSHKKHNVKTTCDNTRRLREVGTWVEALLNRNTITALGIESYSAPRNASVAGQLGLGWGGIAVLVDRRNIPIYEFTPQEVKLGLGLLKSASKNEVVDIVTDMWPRFSAWPKKPRTGEFIDHGTDAAAIAWLTTRQPALQAVMALLR